MLPHILPISSLMLGTALLLLGNGLMSTLLTLRGSIEGFGDQILGLMGSAYFVGFLIGTWVVPAMIRRIGHIRAFAFYASSIAVVVLVHALIVHPVIWLLLRLATGIALVGFYTVIESWLNSRAVPERRGQVFAFYMFVNMSALALAQQLLHLAPPQEFTLFAISAVLICLSVLPLCSTRQPQPEIQPLPRLTIGKLWAAAPSSVAASIVSGLSIGTLWSMGPLYAARLGMDAGGVAMLMTATIAGGAILQLPLGRYSDRGDRRHVLAFVAFGATAGAVAMAMFGGSNSALLISAFVFGGMSFAIYPIAVAHLIDRLPHEQILSGNSGMLLLHGIGAVFGPTAAGALMAVSGAAGLPVFFALTIAPLAVFVTLRARGRVDRIVEEAAQFVPMMRTAPTGMEMAAAVEEHRLESGGHIDHEAPAEDTAAPSAPPAETDLLPEDERAAVQDDGRHGGDDVLPEEHHEDPPGR